MCRPLFRLSLFLTCTLLLSTVSAQRLTALHGSPYAGGLAHDYNPAGILNSPDRWDLTLFGIQARTVTNSFNLANASLFGRNDSVYAQSKEGSYRRYAHVAHTGQLLHFRYRIDLRSAISFGVNLRNYVHAQVSPAYFSDTITNLTGFLRANNGLERFYGNAQSSNWAEYNFGYSRLISSSDAGRLQGGVNLRFMKSLAGGFGRLSDVQVGAEMVNGQPVYQLLNAKGVFGYSANTDQLNEDESLSVNARRFYKASKTNIGLNLGIEYVRYFDDMSGEARAITDYNWKLGISLMDLGLNRYAFGNKSFAFSSMKQAIDYRRIDRAADDIGNYRQLRDTLSAWSQRLDSLQGDFKISNPARLVVNFDKNLGDNLYVNAEAQLHFNSTRSMTNINTRETSALTITPRWEKKAFGAYLPVQFNTEGNLWVGFGAKAGPLVLGIDNLGWVLGKKSLPNGGFYLALQIRPGKAREADAMPCPH